MKKNKKNLLYPLRYRWGGGGLPRVLASAKNVSFFRRLPLKTKRKIQDNKDDQLPVEVYEIKSVYCEGLVSLGLIHNLQ